MKRKLNLYIYRMFDYKVIYTQNERKIVKVRAETEDKKAEIQNLKIREHKQKIFSSWAKTPYLSELV